MTWTYQISNDGSELRIYDDSGNLHTTVANDGSGFAPRREVLEAIETEAVAAYQNNGYSPRLMQLLRDAIFENIQEEPI